MVDSVSEGCGVSSFGGEREEASKFYSYFPVIIFELGETLFIVSCSLWDCWELTLGLWIVGSVQYILVD